MKSPEAELPMHTILVVDDDVDARIIFGRMLRYTGYRVIEVGTGAEAIATARNSLPDVVLLDIGLPDMDGLAVTRALRADPRTAGLRILIVSAYVSSEDRAQAASAGCDAFLAKPIVPRDVAAIVGKYTGVQPPPTSATPPSAPPPRPARPPGRSPGVRPPTGSPRTRRRSR